VFHPFTLLFYVPNLCFIRGPLAALFQVIMIDQNAVLGYLLDYCKEREYSVVDLHMLLSRIYNVIHYRRLYVTLEDPNLLTQCAESLDSAEEDLLAFCHVRLFPHEVTRRVLWLATHTH